MGKFNGPTFQDNDIRLLETGSFADGTIKCHGRTWKVHRSLLASRLKFFSAAFYGRFSEGTSREVDFPEADPDAVDIMLRHLYRQQLDDTAFDTPTFCIRCWKLADYLQLNSLKALALFALGQHFDVMAAVACSNLKTNGTQPKWVERFFDAFQEVCSDMATEPLRTTFIAFLWVTRYSLLALPETSEILEKWPWVIHELLKLFLWGKFNKRPSWIPDGPDVESDIQNRREVSFDNEITCSGCNRNINSCEEPLSYNPFPVGGSRIGQLMWCKECVFKFSAECSWPWRNEGAMEDEVDAV